MRRLLILPVLGAIAGLLALMGVPTQAGTLSPSFTDFEEAGFVLGDSVNDKDPEGNTVNITNIDNCVQAWRVGNAGPTTEDEEIVDLGGDPHSKAWRLSQGGGMGSLGNAPHSPNNGEDTPMTSGETGAENDAGCGAPTTPNFYGEVEFRSATGATQVGLQIAVQASSHDQRHGFVRIVDDAAGFGAGFDLTFFDTVDGCTFSPTDIDTNLSYADWHTLGIEIFFLDGLAAGTAGIPGAFGNDVVNVYINGALVHTGTSWESCVGAQSVDRLMFSGPANPAHLDGGLYFDDVLVTDLCPEGNCVANPTSRDDCMNGGWMDFGFRNQGQCIRFVNTGQDSRE